MIAQKLANDTKLLQKQLYWLEYSLRECKQIGIRSSYSDDEFGKFETLCARFARSIDFLVRKIWRTLDAFEFEEQGTLIDVVNRAHKRGLFDDVEYIRELKDLRNTIVHEYVEEELIEYFEEVLEASVSLQKIMHTTLTYIAKHT